MPSSQLIHQRCVKKTHHYPKQDEGMKRPRNIPIKNYHTNVMSRRGMPSTNVPLLWAFKNVAVGTLLSFLVWRYFQPKKVRTANGDDLVAITTNI